MARMSASSLGRKKSQRVVFCSHHRTVYVALPYLQRIAQQFVVVQPDRRLALQTKLLKERNAHLLGAANAVRGTGSTLGSGEE